MKKKLTREHQCAKCPWRKDTDPNDIPGGYSRVKHENLAETIAHSAMDFSTRPAMACHESTAGEEFFCIGWLHHQLGRGNNVPLRMMMRAYDLTGLKLVGEQHATLEDTMGKE